jgi:hypothetical protein
MMHFTTSELVALFAAFVVAGLLVIPHVPRWAAFAAAVMLALYNLALILGDGPTVTRVVLAIALSLGAARVWWRDLRGAANRRYR